MRKTKDSAGGGGPGQRERPSTGPRFTPSSSDITAERPSRGGSQTTRTTR